MTHQVYRYYDKYGQLLYVGQAQCSISRAYTHRSKSPWFHLVDSWSIEIVASRDEALRIEAQCVRDCDPLYNIDGQPEGARKAAAKERKERLIDEQETKKSLLFSIPIPESYNRTLSEPETLLRDLRAERNLFYGECEALDRSKSDVLDYARALQDALSELLLADAAARRRAMRVVADRKQA